VLLLENPEQLAMLREDVSLLPRAVEELLRLLSPTTTVPKCLRDGIARDDLWIRPGEVRQDVTKPASAAMLQAMSALDSVGRCRVRRLLLAAMSAAALAGCGGASTSSSPSGTPSQTSTATTTRTESRARRRTPRHAGRVPAHAAPVGRAQRVHAGDATLSVTVSRVYGSLSDTGAALLPGTHAAGVQLTIRNDAGATYDSTASGDVSVITSSGAAAPLFIKQGVCQTPLTDFESLIGVGETRTGCVGFTVPHGARVVGVRFSPHSRAPGTVTWR
jgi:hypothetical protein